MPRPRLKRRQHTKEEAVFGAAVLPDQEGQDPYSGKRKCDSSHKAAGRGMSVLTADGNGVVAWTALPVSCCLQPGPYAPPIHAAIMESRPGELWARGLARRDPDLLRGRLLASRDGSHCGDLPADGCAALGLGCRLGRQPRRRVEIRHPNHPDRG
jgi:hypothetical protein